MYKGYLIDLDGTAYVGKTPIQATIDFTKRLQNSGIEFLFLTNNASKDNEKAAQELNDMGYDIKADNVYTSANATVAYIKDYYPNSKVYVIGTEDLKKQLSKEFEIVSEKADIVVIGYNDKVTYEEIAKACILVQNGAKLIATNPDLIMPNEKGGIPGNGSIVKIVELVSKTQALVMGKPESIILDKAIEQMGLSKEQVALIGDNYDTDIMCGLKNKLDTIYVQTGVTSLEELKTKSIQPKYIIKDLNDWIEL